MSLNKYRLWCVTEQANKYVWSDTGVPTLCPTNTAHTIDQALTVIVDRADNAVQKVDDVALTKSAFGELSVIENTPIITSSFSYNIPTREWTVTTFNGATLTALDSFATLSTGTNSAGESSLSSKRVAKYRAGEGLITRFTARYTQGVTNSVQLVGMGNSVDGLFFGFNGTLFGVLHRNRSTDNWIYQSDWNLDQADGSGTLPLLDPTLGNVYQICLQYLGFGLLCFGLENPVDGKFVRVHNLEYANANALTSARNPSFALHASAKNTGNTGDIILRTPSMVIFIQGKNIHTPIFWSYAVGPASVSANDTHLFTLRNDTTFLSQPNDVIIYPDSLSTGLVESNRLSEIVLVINATITGASYAQTNAESVISASTAGTYTASSGITVFRTILPSNSSAIVPLKNLNIFLAPGETLSFIGNQVSGAGTVYVALTWTEDF